MTPTENCIRDETVDVNEGLMHGRCSIFYRAAPMIVTRCRYHSLSMGSACPYFYQHRPNSYQTGPSRPMGALGGSPKVCVANRQTSYRGALAHLKMGFLPFHTNVSWRELGFLLRFPELGDSRYELGLWIGVSQFGQRMDGRDGIG